MRRPRLLLFPVAVLGLALPLAAYAQSGSFFGPIIPQGGICTCPGSAPDWGCVLQVLQNVINAGVSIGFVVIVLVLVYAGFLLITRGGNPHERIAARNVALNAVIGLAVILGAWLGVDFVMKAVYNPNATIEGRNLGPWNSIWAGTEDDMCIDPSRQRAIAEGEVRVREITTAVRQGTLQGGTGACSPANFQNAAAAGGVQVSATEAAVIACMAGPESSCGGNAGVNYCWNQSGTRRCPRASTAYGPYQILLASHSEKFETPACYRAAGIPSGGRLNCASGFRNGHPIQTPAARQIVARCQRAAANLSCSAVVAHEIYRTQGVRAWTGNRDSTRAHQACVTRSR